MTEIFVFGSNLAGRHGAGAALYARLHHGAQPGVGSGPTGTSYAIPTKDEYMNILPASTIALYVGFFISYARAHPDLTFIVTAIGCGLARPKQMSYKERYQQIGKMFKDAPQNCILPPEWNPGLPI